MFCMFYLQLWCHPLLYILYSLLLVLHHNRIAVLFHQMVPIMQNISNCSQVLFRFLNNIQLNALSFTMRIHKSLYLNVVSQNIIDFSIVSQWLQCFVPIDKRRFSYFCIQHSHHRPAFRSWVVVVAFDDDCMWPKARNKYLYDQAQYKV